MYDFLDLMEIENGEGGYVSFNGFYKSKQANEGEKTPEAWI